MSSEPSAIGQLLSRLRRTTAAASPLPRQEPPLRAEPELTQEAAREDGPAHLKLVERPRPAVVAEVPDLGPIAAGEAQGGDVETKLGDLLIQQGLVTHQQLTLALEKQSASGHLLGRVLLDHKAITPEQLNSTLQKLHGPKLTTGQILGRLGLAAHQIRAVVERLREHNESLTKIMRDMGYLSQEGVAKAIAIQNQFEYFPRTEIDDLAVGGLLAREVGVADYRGFVPVAYSEGRPRAKLVVLLPDMQSMNAASSVYRDYSCTFLIASAETIQTIYRRYFAKTASQFDEVLARHKKALSEREDLSKSNICEEMLMTLLRHACYTGASDVQLFPTHDVGIVKLKVDGVWDIFKTISTELLEQLLSVVRNVMIPSGVTDEKLQDGFTDTSIEIATAKDEQSQDLRRRYADIVERYVFRLEFGNSVQGRTATIRINDRQSTAADLNQLGVDTRTLSRLRHYIKSKAGVFILVGPTGSGKTTTAYAMLRDVDAITESIQTVERPVEYTNGLWLQYQVDPKREDEGASWEEALKGILRNAPDKIYFGETRDAGTARAVFRAANTGHVVVSTLHANGAPEAIARLKDLNIDRDKLATQLLGVLAQRLLRKLCVSCKVLDDRPETTRLLAQHTEVRAGVAGHFTPYRARSSGCPECRHTGYRGRRIVYELLHCSRKVSNMLESGDSISKLREGALDTGSMLAHGLRLVAEGTTSMDELATHVQLEG